MRNKRRVGTCCPRVAPRQKTRGQQVPTLPKLEFCTQKQPESSREIWYPTKNFDKVVAYWQSETLFRLSSGKPYN